MGNFSNGLANNGHPKETKKVLDDYLEETDAIDLVEDLDGKSGSSLVGLDLPPNFMECNRNKGRNHDGVNARRGIVSHGLWEEKPLLAVHGNHSRGLRSRNSMGTLPKLNGSISLYQSTRNYTQII